MVILRELALDPLSGDLAVASARLQVLSGKDALAQRIAVRLRTFKGEWVFDLLIGTPWFQNILGTKRREVLVQAILRRRVANTPGVARVVTLTVTIDGTTRIADVEGRVISETDEEVPISLEIGR